MRGNTHTQSVATCVVGLETKYVSTLASADHHFVQWQCRNRCSVGKNGSSILHATNSRDSHLQWCGINSSLGTQNTTEFTICGGHDGCETIRAVTTARRANTILFFSRNAAGGNALYRSSHSTAKKKCYQAALSKGVLQLPLGLPIASPHACAMSCGPLFSSGHLLPERRVHLVCFLLLSHFILILMCLISCVGEGAVVNKGQRKPGRTLSALPHFVPLCTQHCTQTPYRKG